MADNLFMVQLVTPERVLIDGVASEVILRTGEGDTTFLAGHTPLVGTIEPGVIRVVQDEGAEIRVAGHGGFVQVENHVDVAAGSGTGSGASSAASSGASGEDGTRVTLLVGVAELAEEIDTERARLALEASQARVAELGGGSGSGAGGGDDERPNAELVEAEAAVLRAEVRLEAVDATAATPSA